MLSTTNSHERDSYIEFFEEEHVYKISDPLDGSPEKEYISVTKLIHTLFEEFNADEVIKKMMSSSRWSISPYYGMTPDQIKDKWEQKRVDASTRGTIMHKTIENYYNSLPNTEEHLSTVEFGYFMRYNEEIVKTEGMIPYRTEWFVYDIDTKIAGSIDMIYQISQHDTTNLVIYDWKRTENIKKDNSFANGKYPVDHLADTNYWHYALQLNFYKYILEKNYGKQIHKLCLVVIHPSNDSYKLVELPILTSEINDIVAFRKSQL